MGLLQVYTTPLMASGQVLLTRCEPRPAAPDTLDEGEIWKLKVNTDAAFYRACVTWLDPGGAGGKKVRRVSYFMAARIASCASRFATPEQHNGAGVAPTWDHMRARGTYLEADVILRVLNALTTLGLFDATFHSIEHAMSCALGYGIGTSLHTDLLIYCSDFNAGNFLLAFNAVDWPGHYAPGLGSLLFSTLIMSGASVDCVIHLLACLGQHYDPALLAGNIIHDSSYAAALRHFENLTYKFLAIGSESEDWVAAPRLCVDFATLWVTLHGADHRLRVWVPTFDKRYLSHLFSIEFSVGVTRADSFAAFMRDHVLSLVWGFSHVAAICVNESLSPPVYSSLSALINLYTPTLSEVTLNSLQGLDGHLKTRGGLVKEAFKKSQTLAGTVTELVSLGQSSTSASDPDAALLLPVSDLTAAPLKGASRTAALASDEFVKSSRKLEVLFAESSRDPLKICTAIFQSSRARRSSVGGAGLPRVSLPGKGSGLMLQVAFNVPSRAALNSLTTDIVAYLHPSPLGSVGATALSADRPHIAFYIAQVFNADPISGAYSTHPALLAASAPSDFVHALLTLRLDTAAFDFVYLRIYFRAIRENTRAAYHTFEEYFCDEKTMRDMQRDGMKITCAMGWDPLPASGLTFWQFIQVILDSVDHMNLLQDVTMFEDRRTLIVHVYHEGLRVAAASALTFLRSVPSRSARNFGAFLPDKDLPSLRQLLSAEEISTAQQLTIQSMTPMSQRREVSTLDHVDRSQAGVKRARSSATAPAVS